MSYPRCRTCKYWDDDTVFSFGDQGSCGHEASGSSDDDGMCYYSSGGSYPAEAMLVHTGPDFGCIHHEPKESDEVK